MLCDVRGFGVHLHCSDFHCSKLKSLLLDTGSMHACSIRWTLKWAHRCTSNKISHTLPVCQEEKKKKKGGKKKELFYASWSSALWSIPLSLHLFSIYLSNLWRGSAASLNAKQLAGSTMWALSWDSAETMEEFHVQILYYGFYIEFRMSPKHT